MSSKNVGIEEARKTLGDLVTSVQQGTEIVLTRNGRPAARIVRFQEPDETYVLANDDEETMTLIVSGDEVQQIHTTDGQVTSDTIAHAGPGAEEWVRECLADYRADGWA